MNTLATVLCCSVPEPAWWTALLLIVSQVVVGNNFTSARG
jgi:hypothetical protein